MGILRALSFPENLGNLFYFKGLWRSSRDILVPMNAYDPVQGPDIPVDATNKQLIELAEKTLTSTYYSTDGRIGRTLESIALSLLILAKNSEAQRRIPLRREKDA